MAIICPKCKRQYDITLFQFGKSLSCDCGYELNPNEKTPVNIPIDGILDLHTFKPSEIKNLISDYLNACQKRGILSVRIIHGKGIGTLQRTVHLTLGKIKEVKSFHLANHNEGGWGATIVYLKPLK